MVTGAVLFYGGIVGMVLSIILFITAWIVFERKKHKFLNEMEDEFE